MTQSTNNHAGVISGYLKNQLNITCDVAPDQDVFQTGLLDSLGIADLIAFLETRYSIDIPLSHVTVENFSTPNTIAAYVGNRMGRAD